MGSVGEAHSCPPAQSPENMVQIMLIEKRLWMQALMTKRLKFSDPMSLWSDFDRPSLKLNTVLHLDTPSTWNRWKTRETGAWLRGRGPTCVD